MADHAFYLSSLHLFTAVWGLPGVHQVTATDTGPWGVWYAFQCWYHQRSTRDDPVVWQHSAYSGNTNTATHTVMSYAIIKYQCYLDRSHGQKNHVFHAHAQYEWKKCKGVIIVGVIMKRHSTYHCSFWFSRVVFLTVILLSVGLGGFRTGEWHGMPSPSKQNKKGFFLSFLRFLSFFWEIIVQAKKSKWKDCTTWIENESQVAENCSLFCPTLQWTWHNY